MTYFRVHSDFQYRFITGSGQSYYATVEVDQSGSVNVRNLIGPQGPIMDPYTPIPAEVQIEIVSAISNARDIMAATSTLSGQLVFDEETSKEVVFDTPMANTTYRVHLDAPDFVSTRVKYKSTTGFIVDVGVTYSGTIGFDVFVG